MNTTTLVVGQKVWMKSGSYVRRGIVAKITPSGVEVDSGVQLYHFDSEGKGCNSEGVPQCGPWYIDDMPFTERIALWEEAIRKFRKTLVVGQEVWMEVSVRVSTG